MPTRRRASYNADTNQFLGRGGREFTPEAFRTRRPHQYQAWADTNRPEATYLADNDPQRGNNQVWYQGRAYSPQDFAAQYPEQNRRLTAYRQATGQSSTQPSSQGPTTAPASATSFDSLIQQAMDDVRSSNAANEQRYQRLWRINQRRYNELDDTFSGIRDQISADNSATDAELGRIEEGVRARRGEIAQGYDQARSEIEQVGQGALQDIGRREGENLASDEQDAVGRGIYSTTVLDALKQRTRESAGRERRDVNESIAGLRGGLQERRTGALADADAALTGTQAARAQSNQAGRLRYADVLQSRQSALDQVLGDRAGFVERRLDQGPSITDIANIVAQNNQAYEARRAAQRSQRTNLFGSLIGGAAGVLGSVLCDRRLKRDIRKVGEDSGLSVYEWRYTTSAIEAGRGEPGKYRGFMADDLAMANPSKVDHDPDGYLRITDPLYAPTRIGD